MAQMAHMMKAMGQEVPASAPILEINPEHEIVTKLQACKNDDMVNDISWVLLDQARLSEGMPITDSVAFSQRINRLTAQAL